MVLKLYFNSFFPVFTAFELIEKKAPAKLQVPF